MPTQKTRQSKKRNFSGAFPEGENDSPSLKKIKTDQDLMSYILCLRTEFNKKLDAALNMYQPRFKDQNVLKAVQRAEHLDQNVA